MSVEPNHEPASRPGIKTAVIAAAVVLGIAAIYYWPHIKAALS